MTEMHIRIGMSEPYMTLRQDPVPVQTQEEDVTAYQDRLQAGDYAGDGPDHEAAGSAAADDDVAATAAAEAKAAELGVDLANVEGSGKGGKVTVGDVEAAAAPAESEDAGEPA